MSVRAPGGDALWDRKRPELGARLPGPRASAFSLPCSWSPGRCVPNGHHLAVAGVAGRWDLVASQGHPSHADFPPRKPRTSRLLRGDHLVLSRSTRGGGDLSPLLPGGSPPGVRPTRGTPRTRVQNHRHLSLLGETCEGYASKERAPFQLKFYTVSISEGPCSSGKPVCGVRHLQE